MKLFALIKEFGKRQSFQPNILSVILNPVLFQRLDLYLFIKKNAGLFQGKLIDFGCGRKPFQNLFINTEEYLGVDIEVSGHNHEESLVDIFYDGKTIPVKDGFFDTLLCSEVVEHLFYPEVLLSELNRVLKIDSIGIFTFPFVWQEHETPFDYARYSSYGGKFLLEKYGFEVIEFKKNGHFLITLWQLFINSIFELFASKNRYLNTVFTAIFIFPLNVIGLIIYILPTSKSFYMTNMFLVKKVKDVT